MLYRKLVIAFTVLLVLLTVGVIGNSVASKSEPSRAASTMKREINRDINPNWQMAQNCRRYKAQRKPEADAADCQALMSTDWPKYQDQVDDSSDDTGDGNATPEELSTPSDTTDEEPLTPEQGDTQTYCAGWAADNVTLGPIQSANEERIRTMFEACMQANGINSPNYEYQAPTYDNPTGGP